MKKQYIQPSAKKNLAEVNAQILAVSNIGKGSKTNDFDIKDNNFEDEEAYVPWYQENE